MITFNILDYTNPYRFKQARFFSTTFRQDQRVTCMAMRPHRCRSLPEVRAMVVAMAGGGLVFKLLQVQMSCDRACKVSIRSLINSHWNVSGLRGVLAAWRERGN